MALKVGTVLNLCITTYISTFCITKSHNLMKNKDIVISFRIDKEIQEYISFLKQRNIRYTDIIFTIIKNSLKAKCKEFNFKESRQYCPF